MAGRPSLCNGCGDCKRCRHAAYMRDWWSRQSPAKKRAYLDKRGKQKSRPGRATTPRDPVKARATKAVWDAIQRGRLHRGPCETCGATDDVQAHHDDYSRPLDVRWLCRKHHGEQHRIYRAEAA